MIPNCISWNYQRLDIKNPHSHGIANSVESALQDIPLKSLIPEEANEFTMFVCTIISLGNMNHILTVLKTHENTTNEDIIAKGSYYSFYLIPSKLSVISSKLRIQDMFKNELYIEIDVENIFSDTKINIITLPDKTFVFN